MKKIQFELHIHGPDEIHFFDDEIKALREANEINKLYIRENYYNSETPLLVATVNKKEVCYHFESQGGI
jgi:hypothetical protein